MLILLVSQFQSTYLYKVRPWNVSNDSHLSCFNPRTYIRYDMLNILNVYPTCSFNPRTYIRYDLKTLKGRKRQAGFNPRTYIRYDQCPHHHQCQQEFQSTYLYKVRQHYTFSSYCLWCFNPRTYIRYDPRFQLFCIHGWFQSTYLYKVRPISSDDKSSPIVSIHVPI